MKRLEFEDYEDFACDIADKFDSLEDEFGDISIIVKYDEAKEIIRELLCLGYNVASIDLHRESFENYYCEYIIGLNHDGVWCEKFKCDTGYFNDESNVTYIMDNCSSAVIPYCKSKNLYEISVGDSDDSEYDDEESEPESEPEHTYTVNGKSVDKKTFDRYVSKFAPELVDDEEKDETSDDEGYSISLKCNLDADEALEIIADMERRIMQMNDMFREMDNFRRLFNW